MWLKASGLQKPFIRQNIVRVQFLEGDQELVMEIGPSWVWYPRPVEVTLSPTDCKKVDKDRELQGQITKPWVPPMFIVWEEDWAKEKDCLFSPAYCQEPATSCLPGTGYTLPLVTLPFIFQHLEQMDSWSPCFSRGTEPSPKSWPTEPQYETRVLPNPQTADTETSGFHGHVPRMSSCSSVVAVLKSP